MCVVRSVWACVYELCNRRATIRPTVSGKSGPARVAATCVIQVGVVAVMSKHELCELREGS